VLAFASPPNKQKVFLAHGGGVSRGASFGFLALVALASLPANAAISRALGQGVFRAQAVARTAAAAAAKTSDPEEAEATGARASASSAGGALVVGPATTKEPQPSSQPPRAAGPPEERSLLELVLSARFGCLVAFGNVHVLRSNFYLGERV